MQIDLRHAALEWLAVRSLVPRDSLGRLGIGNIELKGGEWRPERRRAYPDVYEVTHP